MSIRYQSRKITGKENRVTTSAAPLLVDLYEEDETAWLEAMAELVRRGNLGELDFNNLAEYLADMARRDRREVKNRLAVLLAHWLKWERQPEKRSGSWRATLAVQRNELADLAGSGVLRNHAEAVLAEAYSNAVEQAALEAELPEFAFPSDCPYSVDQLLSAIPGDA